MSLARGFKAFAVGHSSESEVACECVWSVLKIDCKTKSRKTENYDDEGT